VSTPVSANADTTDVAATSRPLFLAISLFGLLDDQPVVPADYNLRANFSWVLPQDPATPAVPVEK
jgi:hypothetical protein